MKVFWSWQSDTPAKNNQYFVRDAIKLALNKVAEDLEIDEAMRPEIDHDTKDVPGLVSIVDTIFQKITQSTIFIGDLTFVGQTTKNKLLPNPNVMIELGHAITSLGPERIILVTNKAYGGRPEDLPFDLRHRRAPITYELGEDASTSERNNAQAPLVHALTGALASCLSRVIDETAKALTFPEAKARQDDRSTWLEPGATIEHHDYFHDANVKKWEVLERPRFYLRVIPANFARNKTAREIHDLPNGNHSLSRLGPWQHGDGGVNTLGVVVVGVAGDKKVHAVTQWFKTTSEVWAFNGMASFQSDTNAPHLLSWGLIPKYWSEQLDRSLNFLEHIGVKGPLKIEAGIVGLKDVKWRDELGCDYSALDNEIYKQQVDTQWKQETRREFLTATFNQLCDAYNRPHVTVDMGLAKFD